MTAADLVRLPVDPELPDALAEEATSRWGSCGVLALLGQEDDRIAGFAVVLPGALVVSLDRRARWRPDPEVAVLASTWVDPALRGRGLGRHLVQAAAASAVRQTAPALEAVGRLGPDETPGRIPVAFLEAVGFRALQTAGCETRMRMDLTSTVRWHPDLSGLWSRLTGLVAKPAPPQPAAFGQQLGREARSGASLTGG